MTKPNETPDNELDLAKISTPRTARVLQQKSWKYDMRELAQQLELELYLAQRELAAARAELEVERKRRGAAEVALREASDWLGSNIPFNGRHAEAIVRAKEGK